MRVPHASTEVEPLQSGPSRIGDLAAFVEEDLQYALAAAHRRPRGDYIPVDSRPRLTRLSATVPPAAERSGDVSPKLSAILRPHRG